MNQDKSSGADEASKRDQADASSSDATRRQGDAANEWEFVQPDGTSEVAKQTNPPRSNEHPRQTAEVPLGTGDYAEPPGGGGRQSQRSGGSEEPEESEDE